MKSSRFLPCGVDQPLAADGHGDALAARDVQRLAHLLVAGVLAGADDQPAGKRVGTDAQYGRDASCASERLQTDISGLSSSTKVTISTRSPSARRCSAWRCRGTNSRLTSTATGLPASPVRQQGGDGRSVGDSRGWPLTVICMVAGVAIAWLHSLPAGCRRHCIRSEADVLSTRREAA